MNKQTKATSITNKTKHIVHERDNGCCIFCGKPVSATYSNAHYIPRSKGGLGIEQNIITACMECHFTLDQTVSRPSMLESVKAYLKQFYPEFTDEERKYKK